MKLMRVGPLGQEKPAILDKDGKVRDLSGHVADIGGAAISPEGLAKIAAIDYERLNALGDRGRMCRACRRSRPTHGSAPAWRGPASSSASG